MNEPLKECAFREGGVGKIECMRVDRDKKKEGGEEEEDGEGKHVA